MNNISEYCIAEHNIRVVFTANDRNSPELIASFEPFRTKGSNDDFLFTLHVDDTLKRLSGKVLGSFFSFIVFCIFAL